MNGPRRRCFADAFDAARGVDRLDDGVGAGRRAGDGGSPVVCGLKSFAGDTEVLLADGGRVAIEDVVVGDVVWATDPETGVSAGREVTAVWPHGDWLIELDTSHGVVVTTQDHHFWNATDQAWQETREFDVGDRLVTTDGVTVTVYGLDESSWEYGAAYDLTVDEIHTYYVTTDQDVPVLVHNTNCGPNAPTSARGGAGPVRQGQAGVDQTIVDLEAAGGRVLGTEVTVVADGVRTRPDLFAELPCGTQCFIEVKTGPGAALTTNQSSAFPVIQSTGAVPVGGNAAAAGLTPGVPIGPTPVWVVRQPWPLAGPG